MIKKILTKDSNIISNHTPITIIAGVNVIESEDLVMTVCEHLKETCSKLNLNFVFKASYDKANRTSVNSYRGPGLDKGLKILEKTKSEFDVSILTDVHNPWDVPSVASVVDFLQLPAFLARQTDLIEALATTNKPVNIKKPQFLSPYQIKFIIEKFVNFGNDRLLICERGSCFGYDNLIVDILGIQTMKESTQGFPIILDITHSLQKREAFSSTSDGRRHQFMELAKAGIAVGLAGIFFELHPSPSEALCDGQSALPLKLLEPCLRQLKLLDDLVKSFSAIKIE